LSEIGGSSELDDSSAPFMVRISGPFDQAIAIPAKAFEAL